MRRSASIAVAIAGVALAFLFAAKVSMVGVDARQGAATIRVLVSRYISVHGRVPTAQELKSACIGDCLRSLVLMESRTSVNGWTIKQEHSTAVVTCRSRWLFVTAIETARVEPADLRPDLADRYSQECVRRRTD